MSPFLESRLMIRRKETSHMKKDAMDKPQQLSRKPFFARLLEEQELQDVAGGTRLTRKYPSDSDEGEMVTMKYPSDSDEGEMVTMKYPSDSDDCGR
jgi:hypothetical protein